MKRVLFFAAVCFLAIAVSGCAFGTRRPTLAYTPITAVKPANNISIKVAAFRDTRPDKNVVGNVRNGWGMKTADVVTDTNIADWATGALRSELEKSGYTVVNSGAENEISGEVIKVYCDTYMSYEGEVMLKINLSKNGKEVLDKTYSGKSCDMNWGATAKSYGVMLERALQQAATQAIIDVDEALKE